MGEQHRRNKVLIPTGYMGSGSSAITDLLSEIEGVDASRGTFEYVFLHCPNGVFDLEDKLLAGNNAVRSDEALHSFAGTMKQLFDKKYWWVGHYNKNVSERFWEITEEYVKSLIEFTPEFYWYYQENVNWKMAVALCFNKVVKLLTLGKCKPKKPLLYSPMWVSFIESERFYKETQRYLYKIFDEMGKNENHIVLDQLLLPFNLHRVDNYFKEDVEIFVIERDPRDVFITNKYYWSKNNEMVPYPADVEKFCEYYKKLRKMEQPANSACIHRIKFEDLIYKYEETKDLILSIVGVGSEKHINCRKNFNPERSIHNTQLFLKNEQYRVEGEYIAQRLPEFLYDFPYEISKESDEIF